MSDSPTFSKEMQRALETDGEKLRQLTGEEHGPYPAEILAERSPAWRELLTGKPRIGTCYRCAKQSVPLKECCGSWGLIEWLCDDCQPRHAD